MLRAIESGLRRACSDAPTTARFGAVSFPQRFGSALNTHLHLHVCIADGVFSEVGGVLRFHEAQPSEQDFQVIQRVIRRRVLRAAVRHGALTADAAENLSHWAHGGGFSLHAAVLIDAADRPALIPPPRRHRHHYCGVFAPHSPLRDAVTAWAGK